MVASEKNYNALFTTNSDCARPIGGNCVGNCRKVASNSDCMRPIGGNCVGNCRKTKKETELSW